MEPRLCSPNFSLAAALISSGVLSCAPGIAAADAPDPNFSLKEEMVKSDEIKILVIKHNQNSHDINYLSAFETSSAVADLAPILLPSDGPLPNLFQVR